MQQQKMTQNLENISNLSKELPEGTNYHCFSVAALSYTLARLLNISEKDSIIISLAASTHDIGKKETPDHILHSTQKLNKKDSDIMKLHTIDGYNLLKQHSSILAEYEPLFLDVVLNHHEEIDGSGYNGLKGNEVSIESNLVSFVDIFDALRSKRTYKEEKKFEESRDILKNSEGRFHPEIYECGINNIEILNSVFLWFEKNPCRENLIDSLSLMLKETKINRLIGNFSRKKFESLFEESYDFEPPIALNEKESDSFELPNEIKTKEEHECSSSITLKNKK